MELQMKNECSKCLRYHRYSPRSLVSPNDFCQNSYMFMYIIYLLI